MRYGGCKKDSVRSQLATNLTSNIQRITITTVMRLHGFIHRTLYARRVRQTSLLFNRKISSIDSNRAIRVCVVGSGPAGFYTSKYLLKALDSISLDMIEALPVPYGVSFAPFH